MKSLGPIGLILLASDWAKWRGPEGNGISSESNWNPDAVKSPKIKWKANVGDGNACVAVAGKNLYTMGFKDRKDFIYCFDAETGKEIWKYPYPGDPKNRPGQGPGTNSTPVVDGNSVFTLSNNGLALCLDAKTGRLLWQANLTAMGAKNIRWAFSSSALVLGNLVIFNAGESGIALAKSTGQRVWASSGEGGYATPVHFKHKNVECVAIFSSKNVYVVDPMTGRRFSSAAWTTSYDVNAADPIYFDGKLFITSGYNTGCTLLDISGTSARQVWVNKNMASHFSSPVFLDGAIIGVSGNTPGGELRALDPKTGNVKWSQGRIEAFSVAGGKLIGIDSGGALVVGDVSSSGFKEIARAPVLGGSGNKWTAPVLAYGFIYCREGSGELVCVDAR